MIKNEKKNIKDRSNKTNREFRLCESSEQVCVFESDFVVSFYFRNEFEKKKNYECYTLSSSSTRKKTFSRSSC